MGSDILVDLAGAETAGVSISVREATISALVVFVAVSVSLHKFDHPLGEVTLLQAVIDGHGRVGCLPCFVCVASAGDGIWDLNLVHFVWSLEQEDAHAGGQVPGDVAMEWPDARVILSVLDDLVIGCDGWIGRVGARP